MIFEAINGGLTAGGVSADVVDGGLIVDFDRVAVPATADDVLVYLYDGSFWGSYGIDIDGMLMSS